MTRKSKREIERKLEQLSIRSETLDDLLIDIDGAQPRSEFLEAYETLPADEAAELRECMDRIDEQGWHNEDPTQTPVHEHTLTPASRKYFNFVHGRAAKARMGTLKRCSE